MELNKPFIDKLLEQAAANPRLRQNYDLRTSPNDHSQRMLNALLPGTQVAIHRHPHSTENVLLLCGKIVEIFYEEVDAQLSIAAGEALAFEHGMDAQHVSTGKRLREVKRIVLDPAIGNFGCVIPQGTWHKVEALEPTVMYEAKDGKYGEDGSEMF